MAVSQGITREVVFLFHSFLLGAVITFVYDGFIILRKLFKHTSFLISLEDLVFWIACALSVFCVLYEENNGMLRWFSVAGAALGMLIYKKTLSPLIIHVITKVFSFLFHMAEKLFKIIIRPFMYLTRRVKRGSKFVKNKTGSLRKRVKKKLTECVKTFRIMICKQ